MKAYVPGGTSQPHSIALLPNHASFCSSYLNSPSKALKAGSKFLPCSVEGESLESFPVKNQVLVYVKLQLQVSVQLPSSGLHATDKNRKEHLFLALLWVVTVATALRRRTQAELLPNCGLRGVRLDGGPPSQDSEMPCDQGSVSQKDFVKITLPASPFL